MASFKTVSIIPDVGLSASATPIIDMRDKKTAMFEAPTDCTQIAFLAASAKTGVTPTAIVDDAGSPVVRPCTAGQWVVLPDECLSAAFLALVLTGPGAAIDVKMSSFF